MKESEIQKQILDWLAWKRIFHYRNNSGAFVDSQNHFYRFGALGSPDIVCVIKGQYVGIEVKAAKGKRSEYQKQFQWNLEAAGGKYERPLITIHTANPAGRIRLTGILTGFHINQIESEPANRLETEL